MAAAAITIVENPATIECDGTGAVITKAMRNLTGVLANGSSVKVWLGISVTDTAATAPALTDAQAQLVIGLAAGAQIDWLPHYNSIFHKTAGAAAYLYWVPKGPTAGLQGI